MLTICEIKEAFIGFGTADGMCPYKFPECIRKVRECGYHAKLQDLYNEPDHKRLMARLREDREGRP